MNAVAAEIVELMVPGYQTVKEKHGGVSVLSEPATKKCHRVHASPCLLW